MFTQTIFFFALVTIAFVHPVSNVLPDRAESQNPFIMAVNGFIDMNPKQKKVGESSSSADAVIASSGRRGLANCGMWAFLEIKNTRSTQVKVIIWLQLKRFPILKFCAELESWS